MTKFHHSKYEKKENRTNTGKNKQKAGSQSYNTSLSTCIPNMNTLACTISEFFFDEKFHHSKYGKKENWTNTGKNKQKKAGSQSHDTIHHYQPTKYDYSSFHSFREIFDEKFHHSKYGKKENWINTGKNKQETAGSQSHDTIHHYQLAHQI